MLSSISRKKLWTLIIFGLADFCNAVCVSLQAPFYPAEAEKKGATPTEYGFVFGVFELTVFLASPLYGKYLNVIGPKFMFNAGIFTTSTCCILFGLLGMVEETKAFVALSFVVRIVEALGNAGFLNASFSIIAQEFPESVATTFASLETCFGLGLIAGPTVGGALYQAGGYMLPFIALGLLLFLTACVTVCLLPTYEISPEAEQSNVLTALKIPGMHLCIINIMAASITIGFTQATLEPHLRQFQMQPVVLGVMFVLNGAAYALSAPVWGWLCDHKIRNRLCMAIGAIIAAVSYMFLGPVPFIPLETNIWLCVFALLVNGAGFGAELVAGFTEALKEAIRYGYPNDLSTYGVVSGLWTSSFAFGAFVGPSAGGILLDYVGFRMASLFVFAMQLFVFVAALVGLAFQTRRSYKLVTSASDTDAASYTNEISPLYEYNVESLPSYGSTAIEKHRNFVGEPNRVTVY